jgi:hypothetical protein
LVAGDVPAIADDVAAGDEDVGDAGCGCGEDQGVEDRVVGAAGQGWV